MASGGLDLESLKQRREQLKIQIEQAEERDHQWMRSFSEQYQKSNELRQIIEKTTSEYNELQSTIADGKAQSDAAQNVL